MTPRFLVQTSGRKMQSHSEMPKTGRVICLFLATQHVRSSSPTWDQIHAPCIGSMEPQLLDCLGHFIRFLALLTRDWTLLGKAFLLHLCILLESASVPLHHAGALNIQSSCAWISGLAKGFLTGICYLWVQQVSQTR